MGSKTPLLNKEKSSRWVSSTPLWAQRLAPRIKKNNTFLTWSYWVYTSACVPVSTPSAPAIIEPPSSVPFWNLCSLPEIISSLLMPPSSDYNTPPWYSSPWTTRITASERRPSLIFDQSPRPPALFEQASTSSSDCENRNAIPPLLLATIQPPKASAPSAPQASSPSSGVNASEWGHPDSTFPRRMSGRTLSALADPWSFTSLTSWIRTMWSLGGGAC